MFHRRRGFSPIGLRAQTSFYHAGWIVALPGPVPRTTMIPAGWPAVRSPGGNPIAVTSKAARIRTQGIDPAPWPACRFQAEASSNDTSLTQSR
jgi:hypothetical protein